MAYPMTENTQGQYPEWQNPTGWLRDEETGLYSWIDPVTGDIVKGTQKPVMPGQEEDWAKEQERMFAVPVSGGAMYFNTQEEANRAQGRLTQRPEQQEPSFLQTARTGIENAWDFEYQKSKRQWISEESAYDLGIDVDGSPLPRLGPDTIMRMKEQAYQRFQIRDAEMSAKYGDLKMKVNQINEDRYASEIEKINAARGLISPHLPDIPESRGEVSAQRQQLFLQEQQEKAPLTIEELQLAKQLGISMILYNTPQEVRQQIKIRQMGTQPSAMGAGAPAVPTTGQPTAQELRKRNTKEAYNLGVKLGYWK